MQKIMFNDKYGLTKAVFDGIKTKTRRIIKIDDAKLTLFQTLYFNETFDFLKGKDLIEAYYENNPQKVPYKKGEIVAVAQKYSEVINPLDCVNTAIYKELKGWNNKMFVRPDLMPRQIRMMDYKIEFLQDITDEDCLAEGIIKKWHAPAGRHFYYLPNVETRTKDDVYLTPREAYAILINKTSGKGTWDSNPFVFAYDFKLWK
jgi:hypothetical protein